MWLMIGIPEFLTRAPRHLFFTGKGGVGKTSLGCASAVLLADKGQRVLLVSADPASNLHAVVGTELAKAKSKTGLRRECRPNSTVWAHVCEQYSDYVIGNLSAAGPSVHQSIRAAAN
jgi:cellulose biosynthesis protein BcsQ